MNDTCTLQTECDVETRQLGRRLGQRAAGGDVIALTGPLGAGKTQLVKGIAAGLNVRDTRAVNSPTFVIINEHHGRLHLYHMDAYRLTSSAELAALGLEEIYASEGLVVIEWADKVRELLPEDHLSVAIQPVDQNCREITCRAYGRAARKLLDAVRSENAQR